MAKSPNIMSLLAGAKMAGMGGSSPVVPRLRRPKGMGVKMGGVADQEPPTSFKGGGILAGVPMSVRGRKPRMGGL